MKILLTAGPIPAKLDSVKVITNKFKGGLSALAASKLSEHFEMEVVKWEGSSLKLPPSVKVTNISDVLNYKDIVLSTEADAYILSAAVANLMPVNPWEKKFPSHNYKPGDEFHIKFTIAPRIIDLIKKERPRSTLIGYKLLDGPEEGLVRAGTYTMRNSRANVIFCNHPRTAKLEKIALTPDGSQIRMTFDEHIDFIRRVVNLKWYRTLAVWEGFGSAIIEAWKEAERIKEVLDKTVFTNGFGTLAVRVPGNHGFITTTRGKRGEGLCYVYSAHLDYQNVVASSKATMNAPILWRMLNTYPEAKYVLHAHKQISGAITHEYVFPGTTEEDKIPLEKAFNVEHHGYYAVLNSSGELYAWLSAHHT